MLINITIFPSILILLYIIRSDKFPEPNHMILKAFLLGVFLCFPAGLINSQLIVDDRNAYIAGFVEEPLKFFILFYYIKDKIHFNEPMDAIVYGTVISLGFASLENISYVYFHTNMYDPVYIAFVRGFTAIPLHASCGIIMGFYFGLYAFKGYKKYLIYSLVIPIAVHSIYNYITNLSMLLLIMYLIGIFFYVFKLHNQYKFEQMKKINESEIKKI